MDPSNFSTDELFIRPLSEEETAKVYQEHLLKDFPPEEQKPLELILKERKNGNYLCYGLFEHGVFAAYAFFACGSGAEFILMDYLAVCNTVRSKGYGGLFLRLLKEKMREDYGGIIFEVESGLTAQGEGEFETCKRRLAFYKKNGLRFTKASVLLYGVDLVVMYLPLRGEAEDESLYQTLKERIYPNLYTRQQREEKVFLRLNPEVQIAEGICRD